MRPIEIRFDKNINNLKLTREADTRRQWEYVAVTMLGALFVLGLLFYGWQHYQYIQYGYRIEEAQRKHDQLARKQSLLLVDRARSRNPATIAAMAKDMGLVHPAAGQLITISPDLLNNRQPQIAAKQ